MKKDRLVIYGCGENYKKYRRILESEVAMGGTIMGYSDRMVNNVKKYISPDEIEQYNVDKVIVTCGNYEEVVSYLRLEMMVDVEIVSLRDHLHKEWGVDRRAVKFLDTSFIKDIELVENNIGKISNFVEIGANFAQDATTIKHMCGINDDDIYVFEAHPVIFEEIKNRYHYHAYPQAVSNYSGHSRFYICDLENVNNNGMSSLRYSDDLYNEHYHEVTVETVRMDEMIEKNLVPEEIDFLKIDVEGNTYEVLEGMGDKIRSIKAIQCEGDYYRYWDEEILFDKIFQYLWEHNFRMVRFQITADNKESDSLWIRGDQL